MFVTFICVYPTHYSLLKKLLIDDLKRITNVTKKCWNTIVVIFLLVKFIKYITFSLPTYIQIVHVRSDEYLAIIVAKSTICNIILNLLY
jgi:hypothetical protein